MQIVVINRREDRERRERAATQLEAFCLPFEFFDAVGGDDAVSAGAFSRYDAQEFLLNTGRAITPGEIGCFASHAALWARAAATRESLLVMEDDFDLLAGFRDAVRAAAEWVGDCGFIRLQTDLRARRLRIASGGGFELSRYTKAPHSTMCYAISPRTAARLLSASRVFDAPVDVFLKKFWEHGQPLYALTPFTVAPSVLSAATTITGRDKGKRRASVKIRRFLRKGGWYWRRARTNLRWRVATVPAAAPEPRHRAALSTGRD